MIPTKNWVQLVKFESIKQIKIGLSSIFPLSAAEATTVVAPSKHQRFPGRRFSYSVAGIFASCTNQFKQRRGCNFF